MSTPNSGETDRFSVHWISSVEDKPEVSSTDPAFRLAVPANGVRSLLTASIYFLRWVTVRLTLSPAHRRLNVERVNKHLEDEFAGASFFPFVEEQQARRDRPLSWLVELRSPNDSKEGQPSKESRPHRFKLTWNGEEVPQILYHVTRELEVLRRKDDLAYWYYQDVQSFYRLHLDADFQRNARIFLNALSKVDDEKKDTLSGPHAGKREREESKKLAADEFSAAIVDLNSRVEPIHGVGEARSGTGEKGAGANERWCPSWFRQTSVVKKVAARQLWCVMDGLLEVTHGLGMVRWHPESRQSAMLELLRLPEATVLVAKVFGLKTAIPGFDDLFGGGLIPHPSASTHSRGDDDSGGPKGLIGVIRGRFGAGKTTLATQLAFEMAAKGGAGILLALEQSPEAVLAQANHFGWAPPPGSVHMVTVEEDPDEVRDEVDEVIAGLRTAREQGTGYLLVHNLGDSSLGRLHQWLSAIIEIRDFMHFPLRFVTVDPLDAVLISPADVAQGHPHLLRNRTQQILEEPTSRGFNLWLTTSHEGGGGDEYYSFLPNIGDVVIRMGMLVAGQHHALEQINTRPLRLLEIEKVRTQRFGKGVHPFEIESSTGIRIYPSGEAMTSFVTWIDNSKGGATGRRVSESPEGGDGEEASLSLGHAGLDLALKGPRDSSAGEGGLELDGDAAEDGSGEGPGRVTTTHGQDRVLGSVRPQSVTTLMGPTGCAKTELALLYLLRGAKRKKESAERPLFIAFRDSWTSLRKILAGPLGPQLGITPEDIEDYLELLHLDVGSRSSGWVLQEVRNKFRELKHGQRFSRVVVDNVAYMDLTSPLVRDDELFVPNLLKILEREQATPMFITSLVEGVSSESRIQTQMRDASHNLIVLRRNRFFDHNFIAAQIYKSQDLTHLPQAFEIRVNRDDLLKDSSEKQERLLERLTDFRAGPDECFDQSNVSDPIRLQRARGQLDKVMTALKVLKTLGGEPAQKLRAESALAIHEVYVELCRVISVEAWVRPRVKEEVADGSPFTSLDLYDWRRHYAGIQDLLELEKGISVRLHALDDYDQPMGDGKILLSGVAVASRETPPQEMRRESPRTSAGTDSEG